MKLIDVIAQNRHNIFRGDGSGRARTLRGENFYTWFDKTFGIPALEVQTPETENNMVSRKTPSVSEKQKAQTSGVFHFSSEKTRGAVERPSFLIGQGGFNPFSSLTPLPALTYTNDKARTDHSGQLPIFSVVERKFENSSDNSFLEVTHEVQGTDTLLNDRALLHSLINE